MTLNVVQCALRVLGEPEPEVKARLSAEYLAAWQAGELGCTDLVSHHGHVPDRPARADEKLQLVEPWKLKRGKGGSLASRQALLHSLVHIENWAVDLAWDIIARFGPDPDYRLPPAFFADFVKVAGDEARHYSLLAQRLQATGSHYGAFPCHDGLWTSASATGGSLPARLAVEHCTHEARGLDVLPQTIHRFRSNGDRASATLLESVIFVEEITHCAAGVRWLRYLHAQAWAAREWPWPDRDGGGGTPAGSSGSQAEAAGGTPPHIPAWVTEARAYETVETWFHALIRAHFRGPLKPPFNDAARAQAGFGPEWYLPLASVGAG
ncbi:hypothetical protein ACKKBF_B10550 [Auxenochlorella protothecoides x Auxenochlorella symbiontica]